MRIRGGHVFSQKLINPVFDNALISLHSNLGVSVYVSRKMFSTYWRAQRPRDASSSEWLNVYEVKDRMLKAKIPLNLATAAFGSVQSWFYVTGEKPDHFQIINLRYLIGRAAEFGKLELEDQIRELTTAKVIVFKP